MRNYPITIIMKTFDYPWENILVQLMSSSINMYIINKTTIEKECDMDMSNIQVKEKINLSVDVSQSLDRQIFYRS